MRPRENRNGVPRAFASEACSRSLPFLVRAFGGGRILHVLSLFFVARKGSRLHHSCAPPTKADEGAAAVLPWISPLLIAAGLVALAG